MMEKEGFHFNINDLNFLIKTFFIWSMYQHMHHYLDACKK